MASANVVFGVSKGGLPVGDAAFTSEAVADGGTSGASPAGCSYMRVTAIGGAIYVAFSTGTPDPSTNPRVYIPSESAVEFSVLTGTKVKVLAA